MTLQETSMTATELYVTRTSHGLSAGDLAKFLHVSERTLRRWEAGGAKIPDGAAQQVRTLPQVIQDISTRVASDYQTALEHGLWSYDMPLSAHELPVEAQGHIPLALWEAGAALAAEQHGVRLTSPRDMP